MGEQIMSYTKQQADYLHDTGKMPDWVWLQQNGQTAQENYAYQKQKMKNENELREDFKRQLEAELETALEKILGELLKDFKG